MIGTFLKSGKFWYWLVSECAAGLNILLKLLQHYVDIAQHYLSHTYPRLYLVKKKCAWKMILTTFFKCWVVNLNPEFKKNLWRDFWKNAIWRFLPYKAESDLRAKSLSRAPFKATNYQNATNMWFPIENLRKNIICFLKSSLFATGRGKNLFSQ